MMNHPQPSQSRSGDPSSHVAHYVPADQPNAVHELAGRLLSAYTVDGGRAHLAGCTLDEVPLVRLAGEDPGSPGGRGLLFGPAHTEGRAVDDALRATLGTDALVAADRPSVVSPRDIDRLLAAAARSWGLDAGAPALSPQWEIIWCRYARGKIQFTIGDAVAQIKFAGWARVIEPPPFHCQVTDTETFAVAATSDGRIVAADQLGRCDVSGRRLPFSELVRCAATNQLVAKDLTVTCPASGEPVLKSELVACPTCGQQVCPAAVTGNRCAACRRLTTARRDDPRIRTILSRYPRLSAWQWLRLSETESVYIVTAAGIFERRLLVLEKPSLEIRRAARTTRLRTTWDGVPLAELETFW